MTVMVSKKNPLTITKNTVCRFEFPAYMGKIKMKTKLKTLIEKLK